LLEPRINAFGEPVLTHVQKCQLNVEQRSPLWAVDKASTMRQRDVDTDLPNMLNSSDLAMLLLDGQLNIRFFTALAVWLFKIGPADVGRPFANFVNRFCGVDLLAEAGAVLATQVPLNRDIADGWGAPYRFRISPYRTQTDRVEGVILTFDDITELKRADQELAAAKQATEQANRDKSRLLAVASHDLREPLQILTGLHDLLESKVRDEGARKLVARIGAVLDSMSNTLDALLDIDRLAAGAFRRQIADLPIGEILDKLYADFAYEAVDKGIAWRVVPCRLTVRSDPRLITQMLRNLVSNAFRYTPKGGVLLGCRRRGDRLRVEVWDTGVGIGKNELPQIFDEYHQVAGYAENGGLGLGLAIVQRLAELLGHPIGARSRPGKGSVFTIEVPLAR
jgi:two-component system CheB/CheR fusion protein